jgi:hypothetical protein
MALIQRTTPGAIARAAESVFIAALSQAQLPFTG